MNKLFSVFLVLLIGGCAGIGTQPDLSVTPLATSDLQVVENSHFDRFVVSDHKVFQQYNKVIFFPMQFDKFTIDANSQRELRNSWNDSSWNEMDAVCQQFDDFAKKIFDEREGFTPTKKGGDNVLAIEFRLMNFQPYAKRHKDAALDTVGTTSSNIGLGTITFQAVIANSKTGELLAVIEDGMEVDSSGVKSENTSFQIGTNNKTSQNRAWRSVFKRWVSLLHDDLGRLQTQNPNT